MAQTKAHVKDGRLIILAQDAIEPGVTSLPLEQVQSGAFEITTGDNGICKLGFRPVGRKTSDALATYTSRAKADKALRHVYTAISGGGSSVFVKIAKITGVIVLVLVVLFVLLVIFAPRQNATLTGEAAPTDVAAPTPTAADAPLPTGVPFPVDDFVKQTQGESE